MYEARQNREKVSRRIGKSRVENCHTENKLMQKETVKRSVLQCAALIIVKSSEILENNQRMRLLIQATQRLRSLPPICVKIKQSDAIVYLDGNRTDPIGVNDNIDILGHSYRKLPGGLDSEKLTNLLGSVFTIPQNWNGNIRIFSCSVGSNEAFQKNMFNHMKNRYSDFESVQASTQPVNHNNIPPVQNGTWSVYKGGNDFKTEPLHPYDPSASKHGFLYTKQQQTKLEMVALEQLYPKIKERYDLLQNEFNSCDESFKRYFKNFYAKLQAFFNNKNKTIDYNFYLYINFLYKKLLENKARLDAVVKKTTNRNRNPHIIIPTTNASHHARFATRRQRV